MSKKYYNKVLQNCVFTVKKRKKKTKVLVLLQVMKTQGQTGARMVNRWWWILRQKKVEKEENLHRVSWRIVVIVIILTGREKWR